MAESRLVAFYRGDGRDHRGRLLSHIYGFNFSELEFHHDYIQWLFPLPEPSGANASAPLLTNADIASFAGDAFLGEALLRSFQVMLAFYGLTLATRGLEWEVRRATNFRERSSQWLTTGNHNFLRISRILRSLTLLGHEKYAQAFLKCLEGIYAEERRSIGDMTMGYWRRAITKT